MLKFDTSQCLSWILAIVKDLLEGTDGQVRAAVIKVSDPRGGVKLVRRSIKHIYPIEVRSEEPLSVPSPSNQDDTTAVGLNESTNRRPRPQATIIGEQIRRNT